METSASVEPDSTEERPADPWVRPAKQDRARRSFERVLDASAALLAEHGYEGFSITEVCRRAAVSPGSLYGRVNGKDDLFLALHERELVRMSASATALFADGPRWTSLDADEHARTAVLTLGRHFADQAPLLRPFILRAAVDPRVAEQGAGSAAVVEQVVTARLMTRADDYPHSSVEAAVATAYRLAADGFRWQIAFGAEFAVGDLSTPPASYVAWVEQVAEICQTYLLTP